MKIIEELDKICLNIKDILDNCNSSKILQDYFADCIESLFYGNLINNFFNNLTQNNIKDLNLPKGQIDKIKRRYKDTVKDIKLALSLSLKNKKINENYYDNFKLKIENDYPGFQKIFLEIEKEFDIDNAKNYLINKQNEIKNCEKPEIDFNALLTTRILEAYVEKEQNLSIGKKFEKLLKIGAKETIPAISHEMFKDLNKDSKKMLSDQRKKLEGFERRLYKIWKKPLDLLECLIRISLESGEEKRNKLRNATNNTDISKINALIKIHARALQISNEILVLLKSGYADGANSRWRSLYELAVISFFLLDNNNEISERYLDYEVIKKFREAEDYRKYYKKLGYHRLGIKEFNKIKRKKDEICIKYNLDKYDIGNDWAWIPKSILKYRKNEGTHKKGEDKKRTFKNLEEYIKLDKFRPHYSFASDSIHGGSKGFHRMSLMEKYQGKLLLTGPTNYGLADSIQITAISLLYVSACLLSLEPDFENILRMGIMKRYVYEINTTAASAQKKIEEDEESLNTLKS